MSNVGGVGGPRPDFGSLEDAEATQLAEGIAAAPSSSGSWWDGTSSTKRLASQLVRDGKFDVADANALIRDAKDFGKITTSEKSEFVSLLRQHGSKVTPAAADVLARHFGVQLSRPTGPTTPTGPATPTGPTTPTTPTGTVGNADLQVSLGVSRSGQLFGTAKPGDTIEAINLSTAPDGRLHLDNTEVMARADAQGKFAGSLVDMKEGDLIRMRRRGADGAAGDWVTVKVAGTGSPDTRNTAVNLERIDLAADGSGSITATHNTDRPIAEPGAKLRFTNTRTGEKQDITINDLGSLPANTKLKGKAGDTFTVAGSDGTNNVNFAAIKGTLRVPGGSGNVGGVDLPDPAMHKDELNTDGTPRYEKARFTGPLFIDGPTAGDIRQGAIGNCYFPSAMGSLASTHPEVLRDAIKDNGDGTYTVRFYEYGDKRRPKDVKVDGDLYVKSWGGPIYGNSLGGSLDPDKMELWFPIIEKAYATWKGSYDKIGNGGSASDVITEVMGGTDQYTSLRSANADAIFRRIKEGADKKWPMNAGTYDHDDPRYTNSGVYGDHSYSVLGAVEEGGKKYVLLRNPWGQSEPGYDGKNDGFFKLELDKFMNLYQSFSVVPT